MIEAHTRREKILRRFILESKLKQPLILNLFRSVPESQYKDLQSLINDKLSQINASFRVALNTSPTNSRVEFVSVLSNEQERILESPQVEETPPPRKRAPLATVPPYPELQSSSQARSKLQTSPKSSCPEETSANEEDFETVQKLLECCQELRGVKRN